METTSVRGLKRTTLRAQATEALRRAITSGELPAGSHVPEIETAHQLQISRGTLREAVRALQLEGLLTESTRGRLLVRQMDPRELSDLFGVRASLEALAARTLATSDRREEASAELHSLAARLEEPSADIAERMEADMDFHRALCRLSGNETLIRSWSALEGTIQLSITHAGVDRAKLNVKADRHLEIVEAIESGDEERASRTVFEHMAQAVRTLLA